MRTHKTYPFFCALLFAASLLLNACQAGTTAEGEAASATAAEEKPDQTNGPATAEPESTAEAEIETVIAESENGLLINEDVERSMMFKLNTLAYELPGMDEVEIPNITYAFHGEQPLTMDVYYPPGAPADAQLPVVVFGLGYKMSKIPLREHHANLSWGKLVAAAGMVAISYDTEQPDRDLEILISFIRENAAALRIDPDQIGFLSVSANPPTVMSYIMQEGRSGIQFAVYYYGVSLTPDRKYADQFFQSVKCEQRGCLYDELADVTYVDPDIPLFIVKAGKDFIPISNKAMDYFVDYVRGEGATVTLLEYEDGVHGFDTEQRNEEESAAIIAQTVDFMKANFDLQ